VQLGQLLVLTTTMVVVWGGDINLLCEKTKL
jgi:hypothetical protein